MPMNYLIETCLLTHGLYSISNQEMAQNWTLGNAPLCWIEHGRIRTGPMREFLRFREKKPSGKIDAAQLDDALQSGASGALTASATMEICRRRDIPCTVSCGIGGVRGEVFSSDLAALRDLDITLVATAPKDVLDIPTTLAWLRKAGICVAGADGAPCSGYLFSHPAVDLPHPTVCTQRPKLILKPIPESLRLRDRTLLDQALLEANAAEARGEAFHPAANAALDRLSGGYASRIQFASLQANARYAASLYHHL